MTETIFDHPLFGRLLGLGVGGVTEPVTPDEFSHVQIWRPSQVNARVSASPIIITLTADATIRAGFSSVVLADNDGVKNSVDFIDLTQDVVEVRSETNVAQLALAGPFLNFKIPGGVAFPLPGPFLFGSLQGVTVNPIVTGVGISMFVQWREGLARDLL